MTTATTHGDVLTDVLTDPGLADSPSVRVRARARVTATKRGRGFAAARVSALSLRLRRAAGRWWVWTARPASLRVLWRLSAVVPARVPLKSKPLLVAWRVSNATDRLVLLAVVVAAPTVLTGPLRWLAMRPTRRWAFYLLSAAGWLLLS